MNSEEGTSEVMATPGRSSGAEGGHALMLRLVRSAGISRAAAFAMMARFWQLFTGPITQFLIIWRFSASTQDYYYAFGNLLGMQVFVELGLNVVLINLASREWAHLDLVDGEIRGDSQSLARLIALGRMMKRWYLFVAVFFAAAVIIVGLLYFRDIDQRRSAEQLSAESVNWVAPWCSLVLLNGLQLTLLPMTAVLEGCHQLGPVNRVRFWQGIVGTFVVWAIISSGLGLWALVGSAAVRTLGEIYLVHGVFGTFFRVFRRSSPSATGLNWREEVLPLQWRTAIQGTVAWAANQMPVLVLLHFYPTSGEAGRLGMTWTILSALQSATMSLVDTQRPHFGSLIAVREYEELDRLFFRLTRNSIALLTLALISFSVVIAWMNGREEWLWVRLSGRMLPPLPTCIFSAAFIVYQSIMCCSIYVRAHCRDPYLFTSVVSWTCIAAMQFILGRNYGGTGLAIGYAVGVIGLQFPLVTIIWWRARRDWHHPQ